MCQLLGVSSSEPVRLRFSWKRFAMRGSELNGNPDGWGVAYLEGCDARILREPVPAEGSPLVTFLGAHGPESEFVISHVRRATKGRRILANTQPFLRIMGGRVHVFAHNGYIPDAVAPLTSSWLVPIGETDSERIFCTLLQRLEPLWQGDVTPSLEQRTEIIRTFADEMRSRGGANFLYSDGITLFAHGHRRTIPGEEISSDPGLHVLLCNEGVLSNQKGTCHGLLDSSRCGTQALVATVPLDNQSWRPLREGELLRFEHGAIV